jgi:DNA-binding NtrC family response regulator
MARLLVIEDDDQIRSVTARILAAAGHEILVAESGSRGLELWEQHGADLVITDMRMADVDGLAILVHLRARAPHVPVILMSGDAASPDVVARGAPLIGAIAFLQKPFLRAQLLDLVAESLRAAADPDTARRQRGAAGE